MNYSKLLIYLYLLSFFVLIYAWIPWKSHFSSSFSFHSKNILYSESKEVLFNQQKNNILFDKFLHPVNGNLTETATQYVNFCDENFDLFLDNEMKHKKTEKERQVIGKIRYEINVARRMKLIEADKILRSILSAGNGTLNDMDAKLQYYLMRSEIDMAFMVILQLNIEDAMNSNVTTAVQVMKYLEGRINEYQDSFVNPPVRLLRMLLRTSDPIIRQQMLRQKLLYKSFDGKLLSSGEIQTLIPTSPCTDTDNSCDNSVNNSSTSCDHDELLPTPSAQCEHIVVDAIKSWGKADVTFQELEDTISDVRIQVCHVIEIIM